jgi:Glycosyltransferase like family 2
VLRVTVPQLPGARVRVRRGGSAWDVRADRVTDLQRLAVCSVATGSITHLDATVDRWRPPVPGWIGSPRLPGIRELGVEPKGNGVRVSLVLAEPMDAALVLAAAVRCLRPVPAGDLGPLLTFAPGLPAAAASLAGQLHDVLLADESRDAHVRRCDVLLVPDIDSDRWPERRATVHMSADIWTRDGHAFDVDVDPTVHRPVGRRSVGATAVGAATVHDRTVVIEAADARVVITGALGAAEATALRGVGAVVADALPAAIAHQLSACGVVVSPDAHALPDHDDHLAWQVASVDARRHALRQYGPAAALDAWPTVSVVLVTHRPDHLEHAFRQVAALRYPRLEIVVGAHGDRVDAARVWELAQEVPHPVTVVAIDGGRTLGEALQVCSDRAEGALVTKMDDDDHYGPDHVWDLVLARQYSGAQVVGKALDWVYLESQDTTVFRPTYAAEKYADFVAGGTMLISRADLAAVGGWRPVPKSVDRALLDRVLADGGLVYRTHGIGYVYVRHSAGHTASVRDEHFLTKTTATHPGLIRHRAFGTEDAS